MNYFAQISARANGALSAENVLTPDSGYQTIFGDNEKGGDSLAPSETENQTNSPVVISAPESGDRKDLSRARNELVDGHEEFNIKYLTRHVDRLVWVDPKAVYEAATFHSLPVAFNPLWSDQKPPSFEETTLEASRSVGYKSASISKPETKIEETSTGSHLVKAVLKDKQRFLPVEPMTVKENKEESFPSAGKNTGLRGRPIPTIQPVAEIPNFGVAPSKTVSSPKLVIGRITVEVIVPAAPLRTSVSIPRRIAPAPPAPEQSKMSKLSFGFRQL
jgi:hypothetical protein